MADRDRGNRAGRNAVRIAAIALGVCTLLFVALSTAHIHNSGQDDSACNLCQAAHVGISAAVQADALPAPLIQRAELPQAIGFVTLELFLHNAPSRAPPAA